MTDMSVKILGLAGSPRHGNTDIIVKAALELLYMQGKARESIEIARKVLDGECELAPGAQTGIHFLYYRAEGLLAEQETSAFYRQMVSELAEERRRLFARFLEIEEGHVAIVEAELDAVSGSGFWFGMKEFDLEKG
jgi:rubrerythrin